MRHRAAEGMGARGGSCVCGFSICILCAAIATKRLTKFITYRPERTVGAIAIQTLFPCVSAVIAGGRGSRGRRMVVGLGLCLVAWVFILAVIYLSRRR